MKTMNRKCFTLAACFAACSVLAAAGADENQAKPEDRMAWWREARFGMFICWGIYSIPAQGEWYMNNSNIPRAEYEKYAQQFNPVKFDAKKWVSLAKETGMKYLVITSKFHDGFCMFDTEATDYNVVQATPWKHDPLKDLSEECRKQGIKFCVYYSIMDWHHPDQLIANNDPVKPSYNDNMMAPGRKEHYVQYMKTQMQELITQYQPAVIWFDGQWPGWWEVPDGAELYQWLRKQDPKIIVSDRVKGAGDFGTPEQHIPATGLQGDWETCMTMSTTWGYKANEKDYQPATTLLSNVVDIASKGGNYILNMGPTAEGVIPEQQAERLETIGKWMRVNGEAIYGTTASPFKHLAWGRCTKKVTAEATTLYLMVFDWPADGHLLVPSLKNKVESATLLDGGTKLAVNLADDDVDIAVPAKAPDANCSVVKLTIQGQPDVGPAVVRPLNDGTFVLDQATATFNGAGLRMYPDKTYPNGFVGDWWNGKASLDWLVRIPQPGAYVVSAEIARPGDAVSMVLSVGKQNLNVRISNTGSFATFQKMDLGTVTIPSAGVTSMRICAVEQGWQPINLATVTLTPKK